MLTKNWRSLGKSVCLVSVLAIIFVSLWILIDQSTLFSFFDVLSLPGSHHPASFCSLDRSFTLEKVDFIFFVNSRHLNLMKTTVSTNFGRTTGQNKRNWINSGKTSQPSSQLHGILCTKESPLLELKTNCGTLYEPPGSRMPQRETMLMQMGYQ